MTTTSTFDLTDVSNGIREHIISAGLVQKRRDSYDGVIETNYEGHNRDGGEVVITTFRNVEQNSLEILRQDFHKNSGTLVSSKEIAVTSSTKEAEAVKLVTV